MNTRRTSPIAIVGSSILDGEGLNVFTFDATLDEAHTLDGSVTSYKVGGRRDITSNVVLESPMLQLTGVITNTPTTPQFLEGEAALDAQGFSDVETRVQSTWGILVAIREARELLTVVTGLTVYTDMILHSISLRRTGPRQDIRPVLTFKRVEFATLAAVDVPVDVLRALVKKTAPPKVDKGDQAKKTTPEKGPKKTVALQLLEGAADIYVGKVPDVSGGT